MRKCVEIKLTNPGTQLLLSSFMIYDLQLSSLSLSLPIILNLVQQYRLN